MPVRKLQQREVSSIPVGSSAVAAAHRIRARRLTDRLDARVFDRVALQSPSIDPAGMLPRLSTALHLSASRGAGGQAAAG